MISDRDKERAVRAATWSPSGLSDLGTPFLAVMSATSQLSVFAPGDDLYTKQFAEVSSHLEIAVTS
jgi:general transcription factor 3C protein 4